MAANIGKIGSIDMSVDGGGKIVVSPRGLAGGQFCVFEDPSGANRCALPALRP